MNPALIPLRYADTGATAEADFGRTLAARAQAYLEARGDHRYADGASLAKVVLLGVGCLAFYMLCLTQTTAAGFAGAYVAAVFFGMLVNIDANHNASHNVFLRSPLGNRVLSRGLTLILGLDPDYWRVRHTEFHHPYPNVEDYDLDIEENGFFRQTPFQRWRPYMRFQHRYWPLMAALSLPWIVWVFDWRDRLGFTPLRDKHLLPGGGGWLLFLASKAGHVALTLGLPLWVALARGIDWKVVAGAYLAAQMVSSLLLVFLLLGTHWARAAFYEAPADGRLPLGWHAHNFITACDWLPTPRWLQWGMGGLNLHLTHHLFPGWHHRHYPALSAIVAQTAAEFGHSYRCIGYRELLRAQQDFLRTLGRRPEPGC